MEDTKTNLKPNGVLKVVSIPFGSRNDHYAFSVRPGNAVWGSSWSSKGARSDFGAIFRQNSRLQNSSTPTFSTPPTRNDGDPKKRRIRPAKKRDDTSIRDRMTSNMTHVILAVAILAAAVWLFKNSGAPPGPPLPP